jgi:hypothetical protein
MSIFDTDRSGTIGFNEFSGLWKYIKDWQNVFRHFDADRSGSIDGRELDQAMRQFGFVLPFSHLPVVLVADNILCQLQPFSSASRSCPEEIWYAPKSSYFILPSSVAHVRRPLSCWCSWPPTQWTSSWNHF